LNVLKLLAFNAPTVRLTGSPRQTHNLMKTVPPPFIWFTWRNINKITNAFINFFLNVANVYYVIYDLDQ